MTKLTKKIRRSTEARVAGSRPIVLEIVPPYTIRLREAGRRKGFELTIQGAYEYAARLEADRRRKERALERRARRKGGRG